MSRPAKYPPGTPVRVKIDGIKGLPLRAVIVDVSPEWTVRITEEHPVWRGAVLTRTQCRIVAERERKSA